MKKQKMEMLVKRLPNDGLLDLHEILIDEMNYRKANSIYIKTPVPVDVADFCEKTLPNVFKCKKGI